MAENGNRGPNDIRSRGIRRRREPPIIDASASEIPLDSADSAAEAIPVLLEESPVDEPAAPTSFRSDASLPAPDPHEPDTHEPAPSEPDFPNIPPDAAEPVLFGSAKRDLVSKPEPTAAEASESPDFAGTPIVVPSADAEADAAVDESQAPRFEATSPTPASEEPSQFGSGGAPPDAPSAVPVSRFGVGSPVLIGLAVVLVGALAWLFYIEPQRSGGDETAAALTDLKTKVAALEGRPDPAQWQASIAALDQRVAAADADRSALAKTVSDLAARIDDVARQAQEAKTAVDKTAADKATADKSAANPSPASTDAAGTGLSPAAPASPASPDAVASLSARLDGIETRLATLTDDQAKAAKAVTDLPKAAGTDAGSIDATLAALAGRLTAIDVKANGSDARLNDFDAKVNAVDGKINGFNARMNGLDARMNGLEAKGDEATAEVGKLQTTVAALPKVDLAPLQASTAALDGKLARVEGQLSAAKDDARVTEVRAVGSADETKATPIALVGQSIARAVAEGQPYGSDVDALKALGAEPDIIAKLAPLATKGAPTTAALKDRWDSISDAVLAAVKPAGSGSALDRFAAGARALVQVRSVGVVQGDDPAALVSQVDSALGAGDVPAALLAWNKLPQAGKEKSQDWAAAAMAQADAASAAQALVGRAIATLGRTKS